MDDVAFDGSPQIIPSKPRLMGFWGSGFAFATVTALTRLGAIITEHIHWKVSVTLLAALMDADHG
jgi:predicted MFS family arabinose efflux permease